MIIYQNDAGGFKASVDRNTIVGEIEENFVGRFGSKPSTSERRAWTNSLGFMERLVRVSEVPDDCGVLIEYNLPGTSLRIDFVLTGEDREHIKNAFIVELKQWEDAEKTSKPGIVRTILGSGWHDSSHPSYQAWSYRQFLSDMNEGVENEGIQLDSCAYLHNFPKAKSKELLDACYAEVLEKSPIFFKEDMEALSSRIQLRVSGGKGKAISTTLDWGPFRPGKKLIEHVSKLISGNEEFVLLDEQKVAFENILEAAQAGEGKKVIIVKGGPGTGKSVVAINAVGRLLKAKLNLKFIAPNQAFREVVKHTLAKGKELARSRLDTLFSGGGAFVTSKVDQYDALVVDEAHRLKKKGAYMYRGENQVEDIVRASKTSIFFIDDLQQVRPEDVGSVAEIERVAKKFGAQTREFELASQFRCAGAAGFIQWAEHTLQIRTTANFDGWDSQQFEFKIYDDPNEMHARVIDLNKQGFKARLLAGYAWNWTSAGDGNRDGDVADVRIPEFKFALPWNARSDSTLWAVSKDGVGQVGCIHTSQGLEFDYAAIIIGNDLKFDTESKQVVADGEEYKDAMGRRGIRNDPGKLGYFIKNIYKVLLSRGMKGCFVFIRDRALRQHFVERLHYSRPSGNATDGN